MRVLWIAMLLIPLSVQGGEAPETYQINWEDPVELLPVGKVQTGTFRVTDGRGDPVPQAVLELDLPPGSRLEQQQLITNRAGITFAPLVHDQIGVHTYRMRVVEVIDDEGIRPAQGELMFTTVFTRVDVSATHPYYALAGTNVTMQLAARWAHDHRPVAIADPDAPPVFTLAEPGVSAVGIKRMDTPGAALLNLSDQEAPLRKFDIGLSNPPISAVAGHKTFVRWLDAEEIRPELLRGCVEGAGPGAIVGVRIWTDLNEGWMPVDQFVDTGNDGCWSVEVQYQLGDDVLVAVVGDHDFVKPKDPIADVRLAPIAAPPIGVAPDLDALGLPPADVDEPVPWIWLGAGAAVLVALTAVLLLLRRR